MLGGSNAEKWGGNQKKKFSINNSVEAVISLKEKHEGLLKLNELFEGVGRRGRSSSVAKHSRECPQTNFNSQISISY